MSVKAVQAAINVRGISVAAKATLLILSESATDERPSCWKAASTLAEECCVSERSVQRALAELVVAGLVKTEPRKCLTTVYHLLHLAVSTRANSVEPRQATRANLEQPAPTAPGSDGLIPGSDSQPAPTAPEGHAVTTGSNAEPAPNDSLESSYSRLAPEPKDLKEPKDKTSLLQNTVTSRSEPITRKMINDDHQFRTFFDAYPVREGTARAFAIWITLPAGDRADIVAAVARFAAFKQDTDPRFIQTAEKWLLERRWLDDLPDAPKPRRYYEMTAPPADWTRSAGWWDIEQHRRFVQGLPYGTAMGGRIGVSA